MDLEIQKLYMSKSDIFTKEYMKDAEVFADAFNLFLYGGEEVILPEQLHDMDTTEVAALFGGGENASIQVYRDVLKSVTAMEDGQIAYMILGIENQTGIHYAMPVRNLVYDGLQYYSQMRIAAKRNRASDIRLLKDEYLSGFKRDDKLLPVITLVVYFGAKEWDGPKSLHEMLEVRKDVLKKYITDYRINLLEPATMSDEDIRKFRSDLKEVFYFIKYSADKERLRDLVESDVGFRQLKRSTAEVIKSVTNTEINLPDGEECVDMCLAIQQMKEESRAFGETIGEARGGMKKLCELVSEGLLTLGQASSNAKLTEEQFKAEMTKAGY